MIHKSYYKNYNCLLACAAMLLDVRPETLIKEIGHDGKYKQWPELNEPFCYKTFHIEEIQDCFIKRDMFLCEIERYPAMIPEEESKNAKFLWGAKKADKRFKKIIKDKSGILLGFTKNHIYHAVVWHNNMIYDHRDMILELKEFAYISILLMIEVKTNRLK